jgi:hypothetical protein
MSFAASMAAVTGVNGGGNPSFTTHCATLPAPTHLHRASQAWGKCRWNSHRASLAQESLLHRVGLARLPIQATNHRILAPHRLGQPLYRQPITP